MRDVTPDTFKWLTSLQPDSAALNYYAIYQQDVYAAYFEGFNEGWRAGKDYAGDNKRIPIYIDGEYEDYIEVN